MRLDFLEMLKQLLFLAGAISSLAIDLRRIYVKIPIVKNGRTWPKFPNIVFGAIFDPGSIVPWRYRCTLVVAVAMWGSSVV